VKVLLISVTGSASQNLFADDSDSDSENGDPTHKVLRVPASFGKVNGAKRPQHLRRRPWKRLMRIPDTDLEFGIKPVDSFELSDEGEEDSDSFVLSSSDEMENERVEKVELGHSYKASENTPQDLGETEVPKSAPRPRHNSRRSSSSSELVFSDEGQSVSGSVGHVTDKKNSDIEFSSEPE
jgi:hypothetical protein